MRTNSTYSKNVCAIAVDEAFVETVPQLQKDFVASVLTNKQVVNLSECLLDAAVIRLGKSAELLPNTKILLLTLDGREHIKHL